MTTAAPVSSNPVIPAQWRGIDFKVEIPAAEVGAFEIRRLDQTDAATALFERGAVWFADTIDEFLKGIPLFQRAHGHVLLTGLGVGMYVKVLGQLEAVSAITVVELAAPVIALVQPHLESNGTPVTIVNADATTWAPVGGPFDVVWHDIHRDDESVMDAQAALFAHYASNVADIQGCRVNPFDGLAPAIVDLPGGPIDVPGPPTPPGPAP